jgi:hypothetical protein
MIKDIFVLIVAFVSQNIFDHGIGTRFEDPPDKSIACIAKATSTKRKAHPHAFKLMKRGMYVAHKKLPCYTIIELCIPRNRLCAEAVVGDWGPVKSSIDIYETLSRRLKHNGKEVVIWRVL